MAPERKDPSRLRQELRQAEEQRRAHVEVLLGERGPLIRGTYRLQGGRCGRSGCKCERGELHQKAMLYRREEGTFRCSYVPLADRERVGDLTRRYRRASKARTALSKLGKRSLVLADALQETLTEPYPPADRLSKKRTRRSRAKPPKGPSS
jgi:hypothetical protein